MGEFISLGIGVVAFGILGFAAFMFLSKAFRG